MKGGFLISVNSDYTDLWRYNITLVCQCFNANDEPSDYCAECSEVAEVGSNLTEAPDGFAARRGLSLSTPSCDKIEVICYLVRHSPLPGRAIADYAPFPLRITIEKDGQMLYDAEHKINQWPGASIHLKA